jgi:membrane protein implicated in regulation of membrane protease activity
MEAQWLLWLALALAAGIAEIFTLSLVFAMVAGGALAAGAVAAVTGSPPVSVLAFAVSTGLLLAVVRPPLLRYSGRIGPPGATGVAALAGRPAVVTRQVSGADGEVKLAGEIWTARAESPDTVCETGSIVIVTRIDGATVRVTAQRDDGIAPLPDPPGAPPAQHPPGAPAAQHPPGAPAPLHDPAALPGGETPTDRPES